MFIVFSTPTYYKVNGDGLNQTFKSVLPSGKDGLESGLLIMTHDSHIVQPILKPDHVTLMMGSNFNKWMYSSMHMPAVKHVLRLPVIDIMPTQRLLRTWFGKTTLLPSYQRLLGQMDIKTHASASANYVRKLHESNRQMLGAPVRHLTRQEAKMRDATQVIAGTYRGAVLGLALILASMDIILPS
ncbi:unnamed protein product [Peronospora belbahrii]|nr:unnamed protein product [Peronospora belbahrii]